MAAMGFTANSTLDASAPPVSVSCGPLGHWDDWEDWGVAGAGNKLKAESGAGHQGPWVPGSTSGL